MALYRQRLPRYEKKSEGLKKGKQRKEKRDLTSKL